MPAEPIKEPAVSPPVWQPLEAPEGERGRSTISFPYADLDDAVEVAKAVHAVGGTSCQWEQLAAKLDQSPTSGTFRLRMLGAKTFTVLTYDKGVVTLTALGGRICDPQQEKAARVEAFLAVPLYIKVYDEFKSGSLPQTSGLEAFMVKVGVAEKQKDKARQVFQRSAKQAGFSEYADRLVRPSIKASAVVPPVPEVELEKPDKDKEKPADDRKHPLIEGLLQELPPSKSEWSTEDRKKWLEMASTIFNVIYKDSDDSRGSLKVVVERNSAKQ